MKKENKLIILKTIHTIIWLFIVLCVTYMWYGSIFNKVNKFFWISVVVSVSEGIILLGNRFICPLTTLAKNYTDDREPGFDIYLPKSLAEYAIPIFWMTSLTGFYLVLVRVFMNRL